MLCPSCSTAIPEGSAFCPKCGTKLAGPLAAAATPVEKFRAAQTASAASTEPEQELWRGGFSPKAMYGTWMVAVFITAAAVVISLLVPQPLTWIAAAAVVGVFWLWSLAHYAYARLSVDYSLTTQRLVHKTGILRQVTNRIEVIDIDDVQYTQGIIERMFGVGTIKLLSSDVSDKSLTMRGIDNVQQVASMIDNARRDERRKRGLYIEAV
jgi:membrane protein YdbS with pleckstrin-like domain